jgi:DNA-binding NtrC family response regulator
MLVCFLETQQGTRMTWRILLVSHAGSPLQRDDSLAGFDVKRFEWASIDRARFSDGATDLIVADALGDDGVEALRWLRTLRDNPSLVPILAVVPEGTSDEQLSLVAEASTDFATWPVRREEIRQRILRILGDPPTPAEAVHRKLVEEVGLKQLVGRAPAFLNVVTRLPALARSNRPVLITGETGTGKELCARAIHHLGRRRNFPFVPVDCGAVPDHLFENELFGHERGAFTDAHRHQKGLISLAEGGTLFLDEVDSLSPMSQVKLLRFLQDRIYRPLGADRFERADVNVVAATNQDLEALVRENRFRSDLFFRLGVLRLHLVPLRDRREDIPLLAQHFLEALCHEEATPLKMYAPGTLAMLARMPWPGNVRELFNVVQRAFVAAEGRQILPSHLQPAYGTVPEIPTGQPSNTGGFRAARARAIEVFERQFVSETLRAHQGNITQAARAVQQDRRAFGRLVKRHKIDPRSV